MIFADFKLTVPVQNLIYDLSQLRDISHLSLICHSGIMHIAAIGTEYFKMIREGIPVDSEDFSIRVPSRIIASVLRVGRITIDISSMVMFSVYNTNNVLQSELRLPLEADLNIDFILSLVAASDAAPPETYSLESLISLQDLAGMSKDGIQIDNYLAYIEGIGLIVYKEVPVPLRMLLSSSCMKLILKCVHSEATVQLYTHHNYIVLQTDYIMFGFLKSRRFIESDYLEFKRRQPMYTISTSFLQVREAMRVLSVPKNMPCKCVFNLALGQIQLQMGSVYAYDLVLPNASIPEATSVAVPFDIFHKIINLSSLNFKCVVIDIYDTFVCFTLDDVHILVMREEA